MLFEQYDEVLNTEEACEALKCGKNSLYQLLQTGQLKGYRNGRVWRVPKESIVAYVMGKSGLC